MKRRMVVASAMVIAAAVVGSGLAAGEAVASTQAATSTTKPTPTPTKKVATKSVRRTVKKKVVTKKPVVTRKPVVAALAATGRFDGAIASLTFDDGQISHFTTARPALRAAHLNGTFYLISNALGWGTATSMSADQARTLAAEGDELGNHTQSHPNLAGLSPDAVEAEFAQSQSALAAQVGVTPTTCAYPEGASNESVQAIAAKHFRACRGTKAGRNVSSDLALFDLVTFYVHSSTTAEDVRAALEAAKANKSWVIFVYHGVGDVRGSEDVSADQFTAQLHEITASGIAVKTVAAALTARGH